MIVFILIRKEMHTQHTEGVYRTKASAEKALAKAKKVYPFYVLERHHTKM